MNREDREVIPWSPKQVRLTEATREALYILATVSSWDEFKAICEDLQRKDRSTRPHRSTI